MRQIVMTTVLAVALAAPALAQTVTPQQIQQQIAAGQEQAALSELSTALRAHPESGVAWYLRAEAEDASGNEGAARDALARAEQYAPGLPFANPGDAAALQNHLNGGGQASYAPPARRGISPVFLIIGGLAVLFFLLRMFGRRRMMMVPSVPGAGYPNAPMGPVGGPYGPPAGYGGMGGGGIGGSILGGLAAGAGFAAGERVIGDMMGGNQGGQNDGFNDQNQVNEPPPDRDDGLSGSPGWDDNSGGGGGFDPNNNW